MMRQKRRVHLATNRAFLALFKTSEHPNSALEVISVVNISESGAQISGVKNLKKDSKIELHWTPIPNLEPLVLKAICVWSEKNRAGIRFIEPSQKAVCVIRSLVKFHLDATPA